ncbi:hypothetical protein DFH08DRAFT_997687 [Mycena albidolilacea]|uniref:Transmembrane protein n=1 Tax=Mycena albidolilacea TaxID=1033008 RepID=A0AAD6YWX3_9AGAR|nr:hypothetical protein DFH08DRAFT_997687 [Mycena albidolilacea]
MLNPEFQVARDKEVAPDSKLNDNHFAGMAAGTKSAGMLSEEKWAVVLRNCNIIPIERPAEISRPAFVCTELTSGARPVFGSSPSRSEFAPVGFRYDSDCEWCVFSAPNIVIYNIEIQDMPREQCSASSEDGADESDSQRAMSATPTKYEAVAEDNASESEQEEEEGKAGVAWSETESDTEGERAEGQESGRIRISSRVRLAAPPDRECHGKKEAFKKLSSSQLLSRSRGPHKPSCMPSRPVCFLAPLLFSALLLSFILSLIARHRLRQLGRARAPLQKTQNDAWLKPSEENISANVRLRVELGHFHVLPYENRGRRTDEESKKTFYVVLAVSFAAVSTMVYYTFFLPARMHRPTDVIIVPPQIQTPPLPSGLCLTTPSQALRIEILIEGFEHIHVVAPSKKILGSQEEAAGNGREADPKNACRGGHGRK